MLKNQATIKKFQGFVNRYYQSYGRHDLPWRGNYEPYQVLVSELMLQQTQVDRVVPKFSSFMERFSTLESLASSPVADVVRQWQGLGYNRRGLLLQRASQVILKDFQGIVPSETSQLLALPGIGPYTAAAVQAFAFNLPAVVIETNIRTVYISHFFHESYNIEDSELVPMIQKSIDLSSPRLWYSALMDYGTYLKSVLPNPSRKSKTYAKQSRFVGSNRQVRGAILTRLASSVKMSEVELIESLSFTYERLKPALAQLLKEGFIEYETTFIRLKQ